MPSSGAGGPCCHCGRTNSCCWRRGPAQKPILCNACGSRYLVKRNLDNYQPLSTRGVGKETGREEPARRPQPVGRVAKAKRQSRVVHKRIDSDAWNSDREESEASDTWMTDDSAAAVEHAAALLGEPDCPPKLIQITTQTQLKALGAAQFDRLAGAFFASSMRLKPRKPLVVTVSAVW